VFIRGSVMVTTRWRTSTVRWAAIIIYQGQVLATKQNIDHCYVTSEINIEALRHYRRSGFK